MVRTIFIVWLLFTLIAFTTNRYLAQGALSGKDIFTTVKGPYGSCNTCHPNGGSAGRWDSESKELSDEGDRVIPPLKGIGKKRSVEQLEKAIKVVSIKYKVPVNNEQIKALANYVSKL